ncbi:MAG: DUF2911 domain-containing protein [Terrimonas sp.]|nr:DUF2911 domain-containing protein [Terrimonas sp.]OJY99616.1 MAG: hypothetical protein BGP13_06060 [Sphingobacteriales bacterium 40-81]
MKHLLIVTLLLSSVDLTAQISFPALSPQGSVSQNVGVTAITVIYERPAARGRNIFGELVPYGELWRTGAGNCTKIKFDGNVLIKNKLIQPGTYSLFTIPSEQEWTIILNGDTTLYGTGGYDERKDVLRFKVQPKPTSRYYESLTIDIDVIPDNAELNISWGNTGISFGIETETDKKIAKIVNDQLLSGKIKDPQTLAMGAEYYYFLGRDLETALALINRAMDIKNSSWYYSLKIDILTKNKRYAEAIETLRLNIAYLKTNLENLTKEQLDNVLGEQQMQLKELESKIKK